MADVDPGSRAREIQISKIALSKIKALRLSATARSYAVCYNHASGDVPSLRQAVDQTIAAKGSLTDADIDRLYETYLSAARTTAQIDDVGSQMATEIDQVMGMIDAAIGTTQNYSEDLVGSSRALLTTDRDGLRSIVEGLIQGAQEASRQNQELNARLEASKQHIGTLQEKLEVARAESCTDAITALGNRKHFDVALDRAITQAGKKKEALSLLIVDIDSFKAFNDTHGHLFGDRVLSHVAQSIRQNLKGQQIAARYGGDEFALIMPSTPLASATAIADAIRKSVMEKRLKKKTTQEILERITISVGAAQFRAGDTKQKLIARADACLYAAKQKGRNRVVSQVELEAAAAKTAVG